MTAYYGQYIIRAFGQKCLLPSMEEFLIRYLWSQKLVPILFAHRVVAYCARCCYSLYMISYSKRLFRQVSQKIQLLRWTISFPPTILEIYFLLTAKTVKGYVIIYNWSSTVLAAKRLILRVVAGKLIFQLTDLFSAEEGHVEFAEGSGQIFMIDSLQSDFRMSRSFFVNWKMQICTLLETIGSIVS